MEIIHIVLGKANPNRLNGVNKVVYQLATEQHKAGKNVSVWGITPNAVHDYPVRNFTTKLFQAAKFPFTVDENLKQAISDHKTAIFHLHGGWIPVFSSLAKIFKNQNSRYVLTPHGAYNQVAMERNYWIKKIYFTLFEETTLKNAHKIHSIGKSEVDGLQHIFPEAKNFLLPYGFDPIATKIDNSKNDVFTIGFLGRIDIHTKGLDLLLDAFLIFQQTHPESNLWIIGDGKGLPYLKQFIAQKKLSNVKLWGKKFGSEKDQLIQKLHIFAHPSRNEGLPTAVLEAAAMAIPTIVTQATNVANYVKKFEAGIAINNHSVSELTHAMELLYQAYHNQQIEPYRQGARDMLEKVFSWPALVEKYTELYQ